VGWGKDGKQSEGQAVLSTARFDRLTVLARWRLFLLRPSRFTPAGFALLNRLFSALLQLLFFQGD
jgi:hypothetical protein